MKAKELAEKLNTCAQNEEAENKAIDEIVMDFTQCIKELLTQRKPTTDSGIDAVFIELDDKWRAMCDQLVRPILRHDGFGLFIRRFRESGCPLTSKMMELLQKFETNTPVAK